MNSKGSGNRRLRRNRSKGNRRREVEERKGPSQGKKGKGGRGPSQIVTVRIEEEIGKDKSHRKNREGGDREKGRKDREKEIGREEERGKGKDRKRREDRPKEKDKFICKGKGRKESFDRRRKEKD